MFIYLDPSNQPIGSVARVATSTPLPASFGLCYVRFFYQLQGIKAGSLQLYTQATSSKSIVAVGKKGLVMSELKSVILGFASSSAY